MILKAVLRLCLASGKFLPFSKRPHLGHVKFGEALEVPSFIDWPSMITKPARVEASFSVLVVEATNYIIVPFDDLTSSVFGRTPEHAA